MALYFVLRPGLNFAALSPGVKLIWNDGPSAEYDAWKASRGLKIDLSMNLGEVPTALVTGVMDVFVTSSNATAGRIVAGVPGGSLFDSAGKLLESTPEDLPPIDGGGGGGTTISDDFILLARKNLDITNSRELDGGAIAIVAPSKFDALAHEYFKAIGIDYDAVVSPSWLGVIRDYDAGRADAILWPASFPVSVLLSHLAKPADHMVLTMVEIGSPVPDHVITIALLYEAGLGREADGDGLNYWIDQHEAGMSFGTMAGLFLDSQEFTSRFGDDDTMGNADFVDVMYVNILNRQGEKAGRDYWTAEMDKGMTREAVLIGFARSPENMQGSDLSIQEVRAGYWDFG